MAGKRMIATILVVLFSVMMIGNVLNIQDYKGVAYTNNTDVFKTYPNWTNSSTENIVVNSDGYLMADQNDYAKWVSKSIRVDDNRKVIYEADIAASGEIGITIKVSDDKNFTDVKDVQKESLENGFNEIPLDLDRANYTRLVIEFDKNADSTDAVNTLNLQGVRRDVIASYDDILQWVLLMLLFFFLVEALGKGMGWW